MRAIPIDDFLGADEGSGPARAKDWSGLVAEGRAARKAADGGAWKIGDLAAQVERGYASGALKRFAEAIGETHGTVRRLRWVAGAYEPAARARFPELSFSHFQVVAGLGDRLAWLERARRGSWTVERLTSYARERGAAASPAALLCRPIETAARQVARLVELDQRELNKAARAGLADAVEELASQLDELRARLRASRRLKIAGSKRA